MYAPLAQCPPLFAHQHVAQQIHKHEQIIAVSACDAAYPAVCLESSQSAHDAAYPAFSRRRQAVKAEAVAPAAYIGVSGHDGKHTGNTGSGSVRNDHKLDSEALPLVAFAKTNQKTPAPKNIQAASPFSLKKEKYKSSHYISNRIFRF